jgi:hypothetical protein
MRWISKLFFIILICTLIHLNLYAQNESKVVSLTVTSQGASQEEAKNNALRNAMNIKELLVMFVQLRLLNYSIIFKVIV